MKPVQSSTAFALAFAFAGALAMAPALAAGKGHADKGHADKGHADKGHADKGERSDSRNTAKSAGNGQGRFDDRHRTLANDYYDSHYRAGRCPPGLAKKHNGCMPPGQAKKWTVGQPLARNVTYYQVPGSLVTQFGAPPAGYRYVRVESDILLMAIATRMVVDSIQNRGRS